MSALPTADQMTLEEISSQRKSAVHRWRVFAMFNCRVAFVNAFFDPAEAAKLRDQLNRRYATAGALFWSTQQDRVDCSLNWAELRAILQTRKAGSQPQPRGCSRQRRVLRRQDPESQIRRVLDREAARGFALGPPQLRKAPQA